MASFKYAKKHVPRRRGDDDGLTPGKSIQQTVKRNGERMTIKQTMKLDGTVVTKVDTAHTLEDDLQAAQVSLLRSRPDYDKRFTFVGDQNAAKRGPVAQLMAKKTGMIAGEPDVRLSILRDDGTPETVYVENKNGGGYLSQEQKDRHAMLTLLGFTVYVIKTDSTERAAEFVDLILSRHMAGTPDIENSKELFISC